MIGYKEFSSADKGKAVIGHGERKHLYECLVQTTNVPGDVVECGVYKGGSAAMIAKFLREEKKRNLFLYDTFEGMPKVSEFDLHNTGDFADCSLQEVIDLVGEERVTFVKGFIPDSFKESLPSQISFAHIDVDIYESVKACTEWIWPRLSTGGIILYDDYGRSTCPGAKKAVDNYFSDIPDGFVQKSNYGTAWVVKDIR